MLMYEARDFCSNVSLRFSSVLCLLFISTKTLFPTIFLFAKRRLLAIPISLSNVANMPSYCFESITQGLSDVTLIFRMALLSMFDRPDLMGLIIKYLDSIKC